MENQIYVEALIRRATLSLPRVFTATRFFDMFPDVLQVIEMVASLDRVKHLFEDCGGIATTVTSRASYETLRSLKIDRWYRRFREKGKITEKNHRAALTEALQSQFPWELNRHWLETDEWYKEKRPDVREALVGFLELGLEQAPDLRDSLVSLVVREKVLRRMPRELSDGLVLSALAQPTIPNTKVWLAGQFGVPDIARFAPGEVSWAFMQMVFDRLENGRRVQPPPLPRETG